MILNRLLLQRGLLRNPSALSATSSSSSSSVAVVSHRGFPQQPQRQYHERVLDHYSNPRNAGSLDKDDESVGTGLVGAPACGDVMKLQIKVEDGKIVDAKFKTFGCGSAIASSSYATTWVKGKSIEEASQIANKDISKYLSLPPVKLHCSMLAEDAVKAALSDWKKKQDAKKGAQTAAHSGASPNLEAASAV